jgi:hypothetical protein
LEGLVIVEPIEQRIERLEYYHKLMIELVESSKWPFHYLVMAKKLTEIEVGELFELCEELTEEYKQQKTEGFVSFLPLFNTFKQKLNPKLSALEVINALEQERLFIPLMTVFKQALMNEPKRK